MAILLNLFHRVVFSQSVATLDSIEGFLLKAATSSEEERLDIFNGITSGWTRKVDLHRLDGSTRLAERSASINHFNDPANQE
jgi:hypothetical protein